MRCLSLSEEELQGKQYKSLTFHLPFLLANAFTFLHKKTNCVFKWKTLHPPFLYMSGPSQEKSSIDRIEKQSTWTHFESQNCSPGAKPSGGVCWGRHQRHYPRHHQRLHKSWNVHRIVCMFIKYEKTALKMLTKHVYQRSCRMLYVECMHVYYTIYIIMFLADMHAFSLWTLFLSTKTSCLFLHF